MLRKINLDADALAKPHLMLDDSRPGFYGHDVSLLRGGVVFADKVTTVSPTYACEVYRPEFGFGLQVGIFSRYLVVESFTCTLLDSMLCLIGCFQRCFPVRLLVACTWRFV